MLSLNLANIRTAHERFARSYPPDSIALPGDAYEISAPVELSFDVYKDKDQFRLVGTVRTVLGLSCSRCLEPFPWPVNAVFDLRYQPRALNQGEGERKVEEDDLSTAFYENDTIDLGQLMREQFYLSLPMKPLCSEDCRGLCPTCGINRNVSTCECATEWEDPRFAALRKLKAGH
jgi:uncharacterized protein